MLKNIKIFARLMGVLRKLARGFVLKKQFEDYLWENMDEITDIKKMRTLCRQGEIPMHA